MDLHSRHVYTPGEAFGYSWKLSNILDPKFRLEVLEMALAGGSKPQICYSDQGCPFTSSDFACRGKELRSAVQVKNGITITSSLNVLGEQSSMSRSTYVPTAKAGKQRSACPASCIVIAMQDLIATSSPPCVLH